MRIPFSPHPLQHLLFVDLLTMAILGWCEVTLHCSFYTLLISDDEHLFMSLLATCMSSLVKCLFRSNAHFLIVFLIELFGYF